MLVGANEVETENLESTFMEQSGIIRDPGSGEWAKTVARRECDRVLDAFNEIKALEALVEVVEV